jgi:hypothetical protein
MKLISAKEAKELNQNFIKTRGKALDKIVEKERGKPNEKDAISSWFSLEELKEFIAHVETEGKKNNINVDGIRIYFGAYAKTNKKVDKKALSTVFLVPTQPSVGSLQKDGLEVAAKSTDIESMGGMNEGVICNPPNASYPQ